MGLLSENSKYAINVIREEDLFAAKLRQEGKRVISLSTGDPAAYFNTPKYTIDAYIKALKDSKTSYSSSLGIPGLREAVAARQNRMYGGNLTGENVLITQGISEGLTFLNYALIDQGDTAVLFRPYYAPYVSYLKLHGGHEITGEYVEEKKWSIDTDKLRKTLKEAQGGRKPKYLLVANPNNPAGTVLEEKVLREIVEAAKDNGILLVSDEIYDEIVYNGAKFTSITGLARGIPHIILNGASKCYDATGFRMGFTIIPEQDKVSEEIKARIIELASLRLSPNTPAQYAMVEALSNVEEHNKAIRQMTLEIEKRVTFAANMINRSEFMQTAMPNGAFYIFPKLNMKKLNLKDDKEFIHKLLEEEQVQIARGSGFGTEGHIRIVALAETKVLEEGIGKIEAFCKRHSK